jgi:hypothetical protein
MAEETDDRVAVEKHEAGPVIGPAMVEQPAPSGGLDARLGESLLEEAADRLPVVWTRSTDMQVRPTRLLRRYHLRADGEGRGHAFDRWRG